MSKYTYGMLFLGALVGLFAAWSSSPVVITVLPLIFGLVGGAGTVAAHAMGLKAHDAPLQTTGAALIAFSIGCAGGTVGGVILRP